MKSDVQSEHAGHDARFLSRPLAARMRPTKLDDVIGQDAILGPGKLLRRAIEADRLSSIILYGPPGTGKTSIAEVIADATHRTFERTSGVIANVATLRDIIAEARKRRRSSPVHELLPLGEAGAPPDGSPDGVAKGAEGAVASHRVSRSRGTILFIDEIHRFNKAQQDVLLPHVEDGTVTLIGATTHNPLFFVNAPLISRSLVFELSPLSEEAIGVLVQRAMTDPRGLGSYGATIDDDAVAMLANVCEGDARRALNALEIAVMTTAQGADGRTVITRDVVEDSVQKRAVLYDHDEDGHYDTVSAFIKSVRGSDPHAAVYWLAKMLYAGEDPRFVARRLVILASEDIGNADPRGLTLAVSAMHAAEFVGMPEARIILAQATTYLSSAPKSNASYLAVEKATDDVKNGRALSVPRWLRNKKLESVEGVGEDGEREYRYPHDYGGHFVDQAYVPTATRFYEPTDQGYEDTIRKRMLVWDEQRKPPTGREEEPARGERT